MTKKTNKTNRTNKPRPLTIKQKKFIKAYVANDGNGTQAALVAYNTVDYSTANNMAQETLLKPAVRSAIDEALIKNEITINAAIKPIADGLKATRINYSIGGEELTSVDHSIRLKSSSMALRLLGAEANENKGNTTLLSFGNQTFINGQQG